jgi:putative intracellular protease/amidase
MNAGKLKKDNTMKVLMVLTSHDKLGDTGEKTGIWLEEFAAPYYVFKDSGASITLASPKGGQTPLDPKSESDDSQTDATRRFATDPQAAKELANTVILETINADDFDLLFYPGGHGPLWDLVNDSHSIALIETFFNALKPLGLVCHAPAALAHARAPDGSPLVKDKDVTGFSNSEEAAVALTDVVPFLLEDMLQEKGGHYSKGNDWSEYIVTSDKLVTGQNPASSEATAKALLSLL